MQGSIDFTGMLSGDIISGNTVIANPEGSATDTLNKVQIDETIYDVEGGGGSSVTITPALQSGTKVADFTIDSSSGSIYAPTPTEYESGDNITIENGVISATDTTYTAGDNITIENGVISSTASSSINYSTTEQEIGTWIDGSKIFRRTWIFDNVVEIQANAWGDTNILVSNTNINLIIDVKSMSSNGFNQCVGATTDGGTLTNVRLLNYRNNVIQVKYLTLDYTKIS